jgi:hypothetical protein
LICMVAVNSLSGLPREEPPPPKPGCQLAGESRATRPRSTGRASVNLDAARIRTDHQYPLADTYRAHYVGTYNAT